MSWLQYFRKWASKYEREVEAYGYDPMKLIKPFLPLIKKRERGLDVGCGTGKSLEVVSEFCDRVVGVEPVEKMARQAEKKGFEVLRMRGEDISKLGQFDFVSFFASLDYMDVKQVAKACEKIVKKGGFLFFTLEPEHLDYAEQFNGFELIKKIKKRAYEGQDYWCFLLKRQ